jgi:nicotinamidase-related amidase
MAGLLDSRCLLGDERTYRPVFDATARLLGATRKLGLPTIYTVPEVASYEPAIGGWLRGGSADGYTSSTDRAWLEVDRIVRPTKDEFVIAKPKPSAFFGTQLGSMLTYLGVDTVIVTGATTDRCFRATVDDAFAHNYRVIVPIECVGTNIEISHRVQMLDMGVHREVIADLIELDVLLANLDQNAVTAAASLAG